MYFIWRWLLVAAASSMVALCQNATSAERQFQVLGVVGGGAVANGSTPLVVLDCRYIIPTGEETGLVVKWYHGTNPTPVYQWIYGSLPQALGILQNRLHLQYQATLNHLKFHSALALLNPTTELAGLYTCRVSTHFHEGLASTSLVIYNPASQFSFRQIQSSLDLSVLECTASGLSPKPEMTLKASNVKSGRTTKIDDSVHFQYDAVTENYRITAKAEVSIRKLRDPTEFVCCLTLPGTEYRLEKRIVIKPVSQNVPTSPASASAGSVGGSVQPSTEIYSIVVLLLFNVLLCGTQMKTWSQTQSASR